MDKLKLITEIEDRISSLKNDVSDKRSFSLLSTIESDLNYVKLYENLGGFKHGEKMDFYFENSVGDNGEFTESNLIKAIYTAWNVEANLYSLISSYKQIVFAPWESNEFNSDLLKEYGYKMIDGVNEREIIDLKTNKVVKYDFSEVKQLI